MNRETESHFSMMPQLDIRRSSFRRESDHKTTFNTGDLIPIYVDSDILPGDTVKMKVGSLVRMTTPIFPVMDNAYLDLYWFFVPHRIVWQHWREFWGENRATAWEQQVEYEIPQIEAPSGGWTKGTIADYMGIPTLVDGISINHLPFRAYCLIWNEWFRDENLKDAAFFNEDETTLTGTNSGSYVTNAQLGAGPLKAAKFHDYFTSALPSPQKGPQVTLPLGQKAPVYAGDINKKPDDFERLKFWNHTGSAYLTVNQNTMIGASQTVPDSEITNGVAFTIPSGQTGVGQVAPANLYADLAQATAATINQLRQAFAIQEFYEAQARGGSRYIEFVKNIFGVTSPDARMQRPEYLGGKRIPINMDQVLQTSATDATSPQGNTAAFSCTADVSEQFTHSFTEHGTLMCLAVVRTDHTYQQGIERMWSRKKWTDFYVPQFANLGEQAILNKEIYAQGTTTDDEAFGYQEAWADMRYKPSRVSGEMRSNYATSLDVWHYADDYQSKPSLGSSWIDEVRTNVDRTIAVQNQDQFIADFYFNPVYVRPMPVYSIPGMLTHM